MVARSLQDYGLLAIVLGTFFEGEATLVLAGVAANRGYLSVGLVIVAGFVGTVMGDQLYFHLGRTRGADILVSRPQWAPRLERVKRFLARYDMAFILGFRFLYGLRVLSPFAIGMSGIPARRFLVLNGIGALLWSVGITLLGYGLGQGAEALLGRAKEVELKLFMAIVLVATACWVTSLVRRRLAARRDAERLERDRFRTR